MTLKKEGHIRTYFSSKLYYMFSRFTILILETFFSSNNYTDFKFTLCRSALCVTSEAETTQRASLYSKH